MRLVALVLLALPLAVLSILGSGCSKESSDTRTVITIPTPGGEMNEKMYAELIPAFEKANPDIRVVRMDVPNSTFYVKLQVMIAGGSAPDLIPMMTMRLPMFLHRNAFLALDDLMAQDAEFQALKPDIHAKSMDGFARNGKIYGLAYSQNLYGLYYNKTMFDNYNKTCPPDQRITYPSADWDTDKFVEVARKLTRDTDGDGRADQFGTVVNSAMFYVCAPVLRRFGANLFDPEGRTCLLDRPEAIKAFDWYYGLSLRDRVAPSPNGPDSRTAGGLIGGPEELFMQGKIAMWEDAAEWRFEFQRRITGFDWDVAEPPRGPAPQHIQTSGYECFGMSISATTKHPKEAWRFLRFMVSPEGQKIIARNRVGIPILKSLCNDKEYYLKDTDPPHSKQPFLKTLEYGQDIPSLRNFQEVEKAIIDELDLVMTGNAPAADACRKAAIEANRLLKEDAEQ